MRLNARTLLIALFPALSLLSAAGCLAVRTDAVGIIYTDTKGPEAATDAKVTRATKTGTACEQSVLALVATGDASIETAMQSASITEVVSVDHTANSILGIVGTFCTVVRGN